MTLPVVDLVTDEIWALIVAHGTWNEHLSWGQRGRETHLQRLYDAWPYPKLQLPGLGTREHERIRGGVFGAGSNPRVYQALDFLESTTFDRLLMVGHSRGFVVNMRVVRSLEKIRKAAAKKGHRPPPWTNVDVFAALDPVASMWLKGAAKFLTGWLPRKVRWWLNIDGERHMPDFVRAIVATYAIHETRPAFEPTHLIPAPGCIIKKRWLAGVHSDHGGYPDGDPLPAADAMSWVRTTLCGLHPNLERIPPRGWPWPVLDFTRFTEQSAMPICRRALRDDRELVLRPA